MSVAAALWFVQGMLSSSPGEGLRGGVTGTQVTTSNGDDSGIVEWTYEVLDAPPGSAIPIGIVQQGNVSQYNFTPDLVGSYLIQLTVLGADGSIDVDYRSFSINQASGRLIPPYRGDNIAMNFGGSLVGWAETMREWLLYLDSLTTGGGGFATVTDVNDGGSYSVPAVLGQVVVDCEPTSAGCTVVLPNSPVNGQIVAVITGASTTGVGSVKTTINAGTNTIVQPLALGTYASTAVLGQAGMSLSVFWSATRSKWRAF